MIIVSFLKVVYSLKYPGTACLSYLDNGLIRITLKNDTLLMIRIILKEIFWQNATDEPNGEKSKYIGGQNLLNCASFAKLLPFNIFPLYLLFSP